MNPMTNVKNVTKLSEEDLKGKNRTSWHEQYRSSAWIFVGGLPYDLTEGDVICVFSQYGEPVHINLVRDKETGKSKGFCFICYEDQRSTDLAVDNLNGIKVLGRTIRVDHVGNYKPPKDGRSETIPKVKKEKINEEKVYFEDKSSVKKKNENIIEFKKRKKIKKSNETKSDSVEPYQIKENKKKRNAISDKDSEREGRKKKRKRQKSNSSFSSPSSVSSLSSSSSSSSVSSSSSSSSRSFSTSSSSSSLSPSPRDDKSKKSKKMKNDQNQKKKRNKTIEDLKREARLIQAELKRRQKIEEQIKSEKHTTRREDRKSRSGSIERNKKHEDLREYQTRVEIRSNKIDRNKDQKKKKI